MVREESLDMLWKGLTVVNKSVFIPETGSLKVLLVGRFVNLLEVIFPLSIVTFENGVFGRPGCNFEAFGAIWSCCGGLEGVL